MSVGFGVIAIISYGLAILYVFNYARVQRKKYLVSASEMGLDPEKVRAAQKITAPNSLLVRPILIMGTALFLLGCLFKWIVG